MEDNPQEEILSLQSTSHGNQNNENVVQIHNDENIGVTKKLRREGCSINPNNWSSSELSALYTLIKQFGTGDSSLEFIAACGLNRTYEEVAEKVSEIRSLASFHKLGKMKEHIKNFEKVGEQGLPNVLQHFPLDGLNKTSLGQWNTPILSIASHLRGYNHSVIKNAITDAFNNIPDNTIHDALITDSPLSKGDNCKMNISFEKIRNFLSTAVFRTPDVSDLNIAECSVLLKMIDDLCLEAGNSTNATEKAVLRGILSKFKDKSGKDNVYMYADYPCDELTATQAYLDPLKSRDWDIPLGTRKITREDVDAIRAIPIDELTDCFEEDEREPIPVVHIEPSEVNSSKYPPNSFIGAHAYSNREISKKDNLIMEDALNDEEHACTRNKHDTPNFVT